MHRLNLNQLRTTSETRGVLSVSIIAQGCAFHIEVETRGGNAVLTKARSTELRQFRDATKAMLLLRELGIWEAKIDARNWSPEQGDITNPTRPDASAKLREAHEAADLRRTLEAAIAEASDPATAWNDHDTVFDELEAELAD